MTASVETLRALLAAPELLAAVSPGDLAVAERLRRDWPAGLVAAATEEAELRRRGAAKFDRADRMLFTRAGLEQSTAEPVARHRAERFAQLGRPVLDLCCGIGGDLVALAAVTDVVGVDRDEVHAFTARHNAAVYDAPSATVVADVTDLRLTAATVGAVFVDPARRSGDRRGGSSPPLRWCLELPVPRTCVKAAPGVDLATVPPDWEVEFVADQRDLKEAVLWSPAWAASGRAAPSDAAPATRRATVLAGGAVHSMPALSAGRPGVVHAAAGHYLFDPSPAVTRAGAVADLAERLGAWQLDDRIAFLSADEPHRTPYARTLVVEASLPFGVKPLAAELRRLDVGSADLRRRGLAGDVDDLRRRLRLRGSRRATVILTRVVNKPWTFVCSDLPDA